MAKESFYFSHDYNSRNDEKVINLIADMGYEGYGIWWALIENLYNNDNKLKADYKIIAFNLHSDAEKVEKVVKNFNLFCLKDGYFFSNSVKRRLKKRDAKSKQAKDAASSRWQSKRNADALQGESGSNAIKGSIGKDIKDNIEIKGLATIDEVFDFYQASLNLTTFKTHAQEFYDKMQSDEWKYKGKTVDNWKTLAYAFIKNIKIKPDQQMIEVDNVNGHKKIFIYGKSEIKQYFDETPYRVIK